MSSYKICETTTEKTRPWLVSTNSPAGESSTSNNKLVAKKPGASKKVAVVVEPMFEQFAEMYKDDEIFYDIFKNASNGRLPYGFAYKDGQIILKNRKVIKYLLLSKDVRVAVKQCVEFMQNGGITTKDTEVSQFSSHKLESIEYEMRKKTRLREEYVRYFIHGIIRPRYCLTEAEELAAFDIVHDGFIFGHFGLEDIKLGNSNTVIGLEGLDEEYFAKTRIWRYNPDLQNKKLHGKIKSYKRKSQKVVALQGSGLEYKLMKRLTNMQKKQTKTDDDDATECNDTT